MRGYVRKPWPERDTSNRKVAVARESMSEAVAGVHATVLKRERYVLPDHC